MSTRQPKKPASGKTNQQAIKDARKLVDKQLAEGTKAADVKSNASDEYEENKTPEERHEQRINWFLAEASRQAVNRAMRAKCESFYDSEQYDHEDAQALRDRGQNPVVYNEVKPTIDFLIGTERRSRIDFYVVAEGDSDEDSQDAINKTKLLKYLEDTNMAPFERSEAWDDCVKSGLGWLEVGLRGDKSNVPIFIGSSPWRDNLHDSRAKKDMSDARYHFRVKVVDLDVAEALFPDKKEQLRAVCQDGDNVSQFRGVFGLNGIIAGLDSFDTRSRSDDDFDSLHTVNVVDMFNARPRVMLIECWSREPVRRKPDASGMGDPIRFKVRVAIMTELDTLLEAWSPFKHDRFPFIPVWAYRNKRTGMPYSPIMPLLGPQEALNHRMSRSLWEASANQVEIEKGAYDPEVMDIDDLREELNSPDGMPIFENGALSGGKVRTRQNQGEAQKQLMLAEQDRLALRAMSSVNEENRGLQSSATSRVAMDAKAERGSVGTAELFDNALLARQLEGEIVLSLAEQFIVQPMTIRVAGEQGSGKFDRVKINEPGFDDEGNPTYLNDITARRAHFVVGEQAWKQSYAEAAFASLMDVLTQLAAAAPQVVVNLLDVVFEMHPNLPRKKAILERIRAINGQSDPDGQITPEQQQQRQQQAQMAQMQFELQMAKLKADVELVKAKGLSMNTDAIVKRVTALYEAAQAAQVLMAGPAMSPTADLVLASAGYVDMKGSPSTIGPVPTMPQPAGPELLQADGAANGIETARPDGVPNQPPQAQPPGAMQ